MNFIRLIPVVLSFVFLAAHFSRANLTLIAILCLVIPFLLFIRHYWVARFFQIMLILGSIEWIRTTINLINIRQANDLAWTRMAIILLIVAAFTGLSAFIFQTRSMKELFIKADSQ